MNHNETIAQLGGWSVSGAFAYTGTKCVMRGDRKLTMQVNGKPSYHSYIEISLNGKDLYDVRYVTVRGLEAAELTDFTKKDVFCEDLQGTVEHMYDSVMNATNNGFIPLGAK